jgi:hypothetical protein
MDQKTWNRMVEGGPIAIKIKREQYEDCDWDQHMTSCANSNLQWPDLNGEFRRRLFLFPFTEFPTKEQSRAKLVVDLKKYRHPITLKKINCAYHAAIKIYGDALL